MMDTSVRRTPIRSSANRSLATDLNAERVIHRCLEDKWDVVRARVREGVCECLQDEVAPVSSSMPLTAYRSSKEKTHIA